MKYNVMATLICMSVFVSCGGDKQSGNKNVGNQDSVEKPVDLKSSNKCNNHA